VAESWFESAGPAPSAGAGGDPVLPELPGPAHVADVVRKDKGHTEGFEPKIIEELGG